MSWRGRTVRHTGHSRHDIVSAEGWRFWLEGFVHQRIGIALSLTVALLGCEAWSTHAPASRVSTPAAGHQVTPAVQDPDPFRILMLRRVLKDREGERLTGAIEVRFALYEQDEGGTPLWQERQTIQLDRRGHFTAAVGSTTSGGIPAELFGTGKTLWLGHQVLQPGELEQARTRVQRTAEGLRAGLPADEPATVDTPPRPQGPSVVSPPRAGERLRPLRPTRRRLH
jgi:hypothetical protein